MYQTFRFYVILYVLSGQYTLCILIVQIAIKREEAVAKEIARKYAEDKKISKKEKDEK